MPYPEQSIAHRLLDNDPETLGVVMRWISSALTAPRFWSLREEWPDLLQDVLARVLVSLREERFDGSRDLRVYVQGIARFASLEALERRRRWAPPDDQERAGDDPDPESRAIQLQLVQRALDLSTKECRDLIHMYFLEAASYDEIASKLEIPPGTVKSRLFRCLEGVRKMLSQHHFGGSVARRNDE